MGKERSENRVAEFCKLERESVILYMSKTENKTEYNSICPR